VTCERCGQENREEAKFCDECGAPLRARETTPVREPPRPRGYTPRHLAERILGSRSALEGERKQVTVLFADVKGSLELAEGAGPEEWHAILDRFFAILSEGVHRFEGTINQYTGDGIMALFGAPIAHEDHARRACYAALHLRSELRLYSEELKRTRGLSFSVRMGINSGEVVVGKIGDDLRMDYTAQGHTVGLAQRMERLAAPGNAYLTDNTARLVSGFFELRPLGEFEIRGIGRKVTAFELGAVGDLRSRFDLARSRGLSRFVGREREMALLEEAREASLDGRARIVSIVGEAGLGKSRLCFEFLERCRARGMRVAEGHAVSHGLSVPLLPWLTLFRSSFDVSDRDDPREAREKVAGRTVLWDTSLGELLPIVFEFMGIADPDEPPIEMDPEARRRKLLEFVCRASEARNRHQGSVVLWEDLHWLDAASDQMLAEWIEAIARTRTLVVTNFRPEYGARWTDGENRQTIALGRLETHDVRSLLDNLLGKDPTVYALPAMIEERTRGNPFFIEEVVQTLVERGLLRGSRGAYRLEAPLRSLEIPGSVRSVLAARIDRLEEELKALLQTASVLGKSFEEPVLERTTGWPRSRLASPLAALQSAEMIFEETIYPVRKLAFKHPLTQEVAYRSQLGYRRALTHRAAAQAIESLHPEQLDEKAALLAHHWEGADEPMEAARWHARAASWVGTNDIPESLRHARRVLVLLTRGDDVEANLRLGVQTRSRLLQLAWRGGMPHEEEDRLFAEGAALAERLGDDRQRAMLAIPYGECRSIRGDEEGRERHSRDAYESALASGDLDLALSALVPLASSLHMRGRVHEALALLERHASALEGDTGDAAFWGFSVSAYLLGIRGHLRASAGRFVEAYGDVERSARVARADGRLDSELIADLWHGKVAIDAGDAPTALTYARRAQERAERHGAPTYVILSDTALAQAFALAGEIDLARERITHGGETILAFGIEGLRPDQLVLAAEVELAGGESASALRLADECVAANRNARLEPHLARSLVVLARAGACTGALSSSEAEILLGEAAELLERMDMRSHAPFVREARSELAALRGDSSTAAALRAEAVRLWTDMGAAGHARRLALGAG